MSEEPMCVSHRDAVTKNDHKNKAMKRDDKESFKKGAGHILLQTSDCQRQQYKELDAC